MDSRVVSLLVLVIFFAGCTGGDDDSVGDSNNPDDGMDMGPNEGGGADGNATTGSNASTRFTPQTHTWDGRVPTIYCVDAPDDDACGPSTTTDPDDSNTFDVPEGATKATFEFTWEADRELIVEVGGDATGSTSEHQGASPHEFEVPLAGSGSLEVQVSQAPSQGGASFSQAFEFHMELTIS